MQGTQVQSLVWEDPTCLGATKPEYHNYQDCPVQQLQKPVHPEPVLHSKRSRCNEKPVNNQEQTPLTATRESPNTATETQHRPPHTHTHTQNLRRTGRKRNAFRSSVAHEPSLPFEPNTRDCEMKNKKAQIEQKLSLGS